MEFYQTLPASFRVGGAGYSRLGKTRGERMIYRKKERVIIIKLEKASITELIQVYNRNIIKEDMFCKYHIINMLIVLQLVIN